MPPEGSIFGFGEENDLKLLNKVLKQELRCDREFVSLLPKFRRREITFTEFGVLNSFLAKIAILL